MANSNYFIGTKTDENAPIMNCAHDNMLDEVSKLEFSLDNGETWSDIDTDLATVTTTATEFIIREKENMTLTVFSDMFNHCSSILTLDGTNWDVSNVTRLNGTFLGCTQLTSLNISCWDTRNVAYTSFMLDSCTSLSSIDLAGWDLSSVWLLKNMFNYCTSLTTLDVSSWDLSNATDMSNMFTNCTSLITLDVSNWDLSNVANTAHMFSECTSLNMLYTARWDTGNLVSSESMFRNCMALTTLDVSNWDTSKLTKVMAMFYGCVTLTTLDVSNWDTRNFTTLHDLFYKCSALTTVDVSNWDTSKVTSMVGTFNLCHAINNLDVSNWDTSQVTDMRSMFHTCYSLTLLDVSNWDTSKVTNMGTMFTTCRALTTLDVSNWNTSNVGVMDALFNACNQIKLLDLSKWDTGRVTTMSQMFAYCTSLETLNLPQRMVTRTCAHYDDLANLTGGISMMFDNLNNIKELDVTGWDVSNCNNFRSLFSGCVNLNQIKGIETWIFNEPIGNTTHLMNTVGVYNEYRLYDLRNMITTNPPQDGYNNGPFNKAKLDIIVSDTSWHLETGEAACGLLAGCYVLPWDDSPVNQYTLKITQPNTTVQFFTRDHDYTPNTKWDDGDVNSETSHTYVNPGTYRVVSNLYPNSTEKISGSDTTVLPIETAILGHSETYPLLSLYRLFRYCRHLISCDISDACGYISNFDMTSTFFMCTSLTDLKSPQRIDCKGNIVYLESMFNNTGLPYVDLSFLCNSSRVMYKTTFKDSKYSRLVLPKTIATSFGLYIAYQYQGETIDFTKTDTYSNVDDISFTNIYANIIVNENWPYETGHVYGLEAPYKVIKKANEDNIYTINITDPTREVKLNNRMAVSSPKTDWGDGVEDDKLSHVYTEAGHYTIVSNLLPGRNLGRVTERDKEWLLTAKLGSFAPTDMSMYFANAFNMTRCDLSNVDFSHVTDMSYLFKDNYRLTDIIWDTDPHVVIVDTTTHIEVADLMMTLNGSNYAYQIDDAINVTTVSYSSDGGVVELRPQFDKETRALTLKGGYIPVTNLKVDYEKEALVYSGTMDTRKVVSMRHAFGNCQSLKRLDLSQWDFAACTDFSHLFFNCQSLSEVIFKQGSTIPGNMDFMFANCYSLSNINAIEPVFEFTPKSISFMFANCIGLGDSGMTLTFEAEANTKNMFLKCEIQFRTDEATQTIIEANRNHGAKELTYRF